MSSLIEILECDGESILQGIKDRQPFHVVTFQIEVACFPHRFSVHVKGRDRQYFLLYSATFTSPQCPAALSDLQLFELCENDLRRHLIDHMFPADLSDFFCVQMVRDEWHPCGDLA